MLGTTVFALALVSIDITPTRVVEATVSRYSSLVKRELVMPASGEAIIAEPPTTQYNRLWIAEESKTLVRDVVVSLDGENPLYRVRAAPGTKIFIYSDQLGLRWEPAYSAEIISAEQLALSAKQVIVNDIEDFANVQFVLTEYPWWEETTAGFRYSDRFPFPNTGKLNIDQFTACSFPPSYQQIVHWNSGCILEYIKGLSVEHSRDNLILNSVRNVSFNKGEKYSLKLVEGEFVTQLVRNFSLQSSKHTGSAEYEYAAAEVTEEISLVGVPWVSLVEHQIPVSKNGRVIYEGILRKSIEDSTTRIFIRKLNDVPEDEEREVSRKRVVLYNTKFDQVTMSGKISISNPEKYGWKAQVSKAFRGDLLGHTNEVASFSQNLYETAMNPITVMVWTTPLKPGESKSLAYTYEMFEKVN